MGDELKELILSPAVGDRAALWGQLAVLVCVGMLPSIVHKGSLLLQNVCNHTLCALS